MSETTITGDMRYGLHVTTDTAEWLCAFAAGFKGGKADVHAFKAVGSALSDAFGDKREPDADGRMIFALYLPQFDADGVSAETIMNRVASVLDKRAGRSKRDKGAIAELRAEISGAMADAYPVPAETPAPVVTPALPVILPEAVADMVNVSAPESDADAPETPAPVKPRRTRKAKGAPVPADVPAEPVPVAEITVPAPVGDVVASIGARVGAMLNTHSATAERVGKMSPAERRDAAGRLMIDFNECVALKRDADGNGTPLATLDADAAKIMFAAWKIMRHLYAVITGDPKITGKLGKNEKRTYRRAVAPWRSDASAGLPSGSGE